MFELCIRRLRYRIAGLIGHGDLRNGIAPGTILVISKPGVIRVETDEHIAVAVLIAVGSDHAHIDMVAKQGLVLI